MKQNIDQIGMALAAGYQTTPCLLRHPPSSFKARKQLYTKPSAHQGS